MRKTRREFLTRVAQAGGYGATFTTLQTLGMLPLTASASKLDLPPGAGKGVKVAVLGGGIAGLAAAYEMGKAGYQCVLLEARERPGGRNWTVRSGTTVELADGSRQTASYISPNSYFNAGPARIPSIHGTLLGYCRELGVALEVEVNTSRSALMAGRGAFAGKPVEQRQVVNDTRGHVSELLAKCINQGALDRELTKEDRDRMLGFLNTYGDLRDGYKYKGSERSGAARLPGAGPVTEQLRDPLDLHSLLDAGFWSGVMFEETLDMQATMFQPVGGMDRIPYAFAKRLGKTIQYRSVVKEIRKTPTGVKVVYRQGGQDRSVTVDYCVCALPVMMLRGIPNDFAPRVKQAIDATFYTDSYKIAWESKRFWEREFDIYGGISWLFGGPISLVWYPSGYLHSDTGVLLSGYGQEGATTPMARLATLDAKFEASRAAVEQLHPGYGKYLSGPMYVNWEKVPYNRGAWVTTGRGYYDGPYLEFTRPDDRIYFAGDHCSRTGIWQEGALLAAHRAVAMISERVKSEKA